MRKIIMAGSVALFVLAAGNAAEARGCIKGALVGGVAGHFAGHHPILGAAAGCAIGHHMAHRHDRMVGNGGRHHLFHRN